jgi:hypothetical protein
MSALATCLIALMWADRKLCLRWEGKDGPLSFVRNTFPMFTPRGAPRTLVGHEDR